jgi:DNA-binding response OmpR family regulator
LKIEVFLKRKYIDIKSTNKVSIGKYEFDYNNLTLTINGNSESLTQKEADLLKMLAENKNQVIKRESILERIWGQNDYFLGRSMDVFISRLRKYFKADENIQIENVHGVGFRFVVKNN